KIRRLALVRHQQQRQGCQRPCHHEDGGSHIGHPPARPAEEPLDLCNAFLVAELGKRNEFAHNEVKPQAEPAHVVAPWRLRNTTTSSPQPASSMKSESCATTEHAIMWSDSLDMTRWT